MEKTSVPVPARASNMTASDRAILV